MVPTAERQKQIADASGGSRRMSVDLFDSEQ
jgi:hypothetical protein